MELLTIGTFAKGVPAVAEGAASATTARPQRLRSRRPRDRLPPLCTGALDQARVCLAATARDASRPHPAGLHAGGRSGSRRRSARSGPRSKPDTAARRDLATFSSTTSPEATPPCPLSRAPWASVTALSDTGLVRESNQDTVYAGSPACSPSLLTATAAEAPPQAPPLSTRSRAWNPDSIPAGKISSTPSPKTRPIRPSRPCIGVSGAGPSSEEAGTTPQRDALDRPGSWPRPHRRPRAYLCATRAVPEYSRSHHGAVDGRRRTHRLWRRPSPTPSGPVDSGPCQGADGTSTCVCIDAQREDRVIGRSEYLSTVVPTADPPAALRDQ